MEDTVWVHISVSFGPGHMGHQDFYELGPVECKEFTEASQFQECGWFDHVGEYWWEYPIYKYEVVDQLPEEARQQLLDEARRLAKRAERMLKLLKPL